MSKQIKSENLFSAYPEADLAHAPRLLREDADVIESNASGMGNRKMYWAKCDADGLRYLASLIEIGNSDTAFAMCKEWSFYQRSMIPAAVFEFLGHGFRRNNS